MSNRLLPCKGGVALLIPTIERSQDDDYIVVALSVEDLKVAEYTHCATAEQAATVLLRYHRMPEVADAFALHRMDIAPTFREYVNKKRGDVQ